MIQLLRLKKLAVLVLSSVIIFSCSKKNEAVSNANNNPVNPVTNSDTLSAGWTSAYIPGLSQIYDIYFSNNQVGYFLENSGIFKSSDGGHNWNRVSNLVGVNLAVTGDGKVFFVNRNSKVYFSTNEGISFDSLNIAGITDSLTDIYFVDNNAGFVFGSGKLFRTSNGGASWDLVQPISGIGNHSGYPLATIFFSDINTGWIAVGNNCYHTNGSMNDWQSTLSSFSTNKIFNCVHTIGGNTIFLTSNDGEVYRSTDNGINFSSLLTFQGNPSNFWTDIQFINNNTGYACYLTKLYKTIDGGNTWQPVISIQQSDIIELYFKDATHGWAVGENGLVLIYNP